MMEKTQFEILGESSRFLLFSFLLYLTYFEGEGVGRKVVQVVGYYNFHFRICHPQHSTRSLLFYSLQTHVLDGTY